MKIEDKSKSLGDIGEALGTQGRDCRDLDVALDAC